MQKLDVLKYVDKDYVVSLTQQLIRIPSESPAQKERSQDRTPIVNLIVEQFKAIGLKTRLVTVLEGRPNIFAEIQGRGEGPTFILYSHCDTGIVTDAELPDWRCDPFGGVIEDGRLYGRGAADTKGGVAGIIGAAKAIVASGVKFNGKLIFLISTASEAGSAGGVVDLVKHNLLQADGAIVGDCSDRRIVRYFKGRVWHEFLVQGKPVHASVPETGINAIEKMYDVITALKKIKFTEQDDPWLGRCTFTFTTIEGLTSLNSVPGKCRLTTDMRLIPGQTVDQVTAQIQQVLDDLMRQDRDLKVTLNILPNSAKDVIEIPLENPVVQATVRAMEEVLGKAEFMGGIESPGAVTFFKQAGIPTIFFGPGSIWNAHIPNEYIELPRLEEAAKIYTLAALNFLGVQG